MLKAQSHEVIWKAVPSVFKDLNVPYTYTLRGLPASLHQQLPLCVGPSHRADQASDRLPQLCAPARLHAFPSVASHACASWAWICPGAPTSAMAMRDPDCLGCLRGLQASLDVSISHVLGAMNLRPLLGQPGLTRLEVSHSSRKYWAPAARCAASPC